MSDAQESGFWLRLEGGWQRLEIDILLRPVDIHLVARKEAASWIMAAKLVSVLS